jgi:porin
MLQKARLCALLTATIALAATGACAAEKTVNPPAGAAASWLEQPFLTGKWGGFRDTLSDQGIDVAFSSTSEGMGNVSGGVRRGAAYNGLLEFGLDADLEKLVGWPGGTFHVHAVYPHGSPFSERYVGDLGGVTNLEFYDSYRLYELWVEQTFFEERFSMRVGQMGADEEFWVSDYGLLFLNDTFGTPAAVGGNMPVASYPLAALGIRLRLEPVKGWSAQLGVYDGNAAPAVNGDFSPDAADTNEFNHYGSRVSLRRDEGAVLVFEMAYRFNQPELERPAFHQVQRHPDPEPGRGERGLAGSYKVGVTYHTDAFTDIYDATLSALGSSLAPTAPRGAEGNYAIHFVADQELFRERGSDVQGLGAFARGAFAPPGRNFFDRSVEGGVRYLGPLPGRDEDELGLACRYLGISDRVADATRAANHRDGTRESEPDYEVVIELTYNMHLTPAVTLQPDVQYVIHPGGSGAQDSALIIGLRTTFAF